jgi:hypothetical protein
VVRNQSHVPVPIVALGRSREQVVELEVLVDEGPRHLRVDACLLVLVEVLVGSTGQQVHAHSRQSLLYPLVVLEDLGVGLLQQHHPDLLRTVPREEGLPCVEGEVVVDHDALPQSVDVQPDPVVGIGAHVRGLEQPLHDEGELADRRDR